MHLSLLRLACSAQLSSPNHYSLSPTCLSPSAGPLPPRPQPFCPLPMLSQASACPGGRSSSPGAERCQDRTVLEEQSFFPPRIIFLLEAQRGAQAGQGHTSASYRMGLPTSNLGLLGLVLKCFETCPSTLSPGLSWIVQSSLAGLSFTRMTYLLDRKEIIKCK